MSDVKGKDLARYISQETLAGGVDFHLHSNASDGSESPERVLNLAKEAKLRAFALTDHDTIQGVCRIQEKIDRLGADNFPSFIPGVELSLDFHGSCHLLGYFPDLASINKIQALLDRLGQTRQERNEKIIEKLQSLGIDIDWSEMEAEAAKHPRSKAGQSNRILGRVHIALALIRKNYVSSVEEAFQKYLGSQGKAYVPRAKMPLIEGINAIQEAGGASFIAHPQNYRWATDLKSLRKGLVEAKRLGLDGLECFHSEAAPQLQRLFFLTAQDLGLEVSAGSDWHGKNTNRPHYTGDSIFI